MRSVMSLMQSGHDEPPCVRCFPSVEQVLSFNSVKWQIGTSSFGAQETQHRDLDTRS